MFSCAPNRLRVTLFRVALRREFRRTLTGPTQGAYDPLEGGWTNIEVQGDVLGYYEIRGIARIAALILAQGRKDGANGIAFHYCDVPRIVELHESQEVDMLVPPLPLFLDLVRLLGAAARLRGTMDGTLVGSISVQRTITLVISQHTKSPDALVVEGI